MALRKVLNMDFLRSGMCGIVTLLIQIQILCHNNLRGVRSEVVKIKLDLQFQFLTEANSTCYEEMINGKSRPEGVYCNRTWDNIMCWPDTEAGTTAVQKCPDYINGFNTLSNAYRLSLPNGEWFKRPGGNTSWTNYTECTVHDDIQVVPKLIEEHIPGIIIMSNVGYGISLVSLVTATFIMIYFRKLRCRRNTIHVNLFLSFIFRAVLALTKDNMLVDGLAFSDDLQRSSDGTREFIPNVTHWGCKLFFTAINYTVGANYMWVFIEGLYLHTLIYVSVFADNPRTKWYIISGWALPLLFVIPWAIGRSLLSDEHCWNTHKNRKLFWIIRGPCVGSVLINFCLFLNIVRVLFTKLNAPHNRESRNARYRRLAKSTLILIPLFGCHIIFSLQPEHLSVKAELILLTFEMLLSSFQGFVVAILLCFANCEVKSEIASFWERNFVGDNSHRPTPFTSLSEYFARSRQSFSEQKMTSVIDNNRKQTDIRLHKLKDLEQTTPISQSILDEQVPLKEKNGHLKPLTNGHLEVKFPVGRESCEDTDISTNKMFFNDEFENQTYET